MKDYRFNARPKVRELVEKLCRKVRDSLFLLRELTIQLATAENRGLTRRFTGLQPEARGREGVRVSAGISMNDLDYIDSLDAEMEQADRYLGMHLEEQATDE